MKKLGVFFGGKSLEHEVSVITAIQLMKHADVGQYQIVPVYLDKTGKWWSGEILKKIEYYSTQDLKHPENLEAFQLSLSNDETQIDVAILCFHGNPGESGQVQGALDLAGVPYQGPGLLGSAVSFDKIITRQIMAAEGIPQTKYVWFTYKDWETDKSSCLEKMKTLQYPLFVKPANSGSSIGIVKIDKPEELDLAVAQAGALDSRILIEQGVIDCVEVNVSVLGDGLSEPEISMTEQPMKSDEFLSFADKYERGGKGKKGGMASATRRIPAPISSTAVEKVTEVAKLLFKVLDLSGVVRIDFFVNPSTDDIYVTEPNTIPGSMSFYLWEASGLKYPELIDRLVQIAEARHRNVQSKVRSYDTNILRKAD